MRVPFDPPPGLISNDTIYAIPGAWADGANMRFSEGRPQTIGGWDKIFASVLTGVCRGVLNWTNLLGAPNIAFGTHTKLYVYVGGVLSDITPATLAAGVVDNGGSNRPWGSGTWGSGTWGTPLHQTRLRTWSLAPFGQTLLACPRFGTLYQWSNDPGTDAVEITQAPDTITVMRVAPQQRQAVAFGCSEELSGNFNPLCVRWCDFEDLTDWTTSSSNNAGEQILGGGGQIVAAELVGDVFGIWTDRNLHQMTYVGNPGQTFQFDVIDDNCGIIGPNAVTTLGGVAYWVGRDKQIRAWSYGSRPAIIPCPVWKDFADHVVDPQADKIIAVSNSKFGEVWFFYPDSRDGSENSRSIFFSIGPNGPIWSKGDFARSAASDAGVLTYPQAVTPAGVVYYHESGSDADGSSLAWSIRSASQYLSEAEQVLQVQRLIPDFKGQESTVTMNLHMRERAQSAPVPKGPYSVTTAATKVDFRASGAIAEIAFAGTNYVRFGKPTFDAIGVGRR